MKWFPLLILCLCPATFALTLAEGGKTNYTIVAGPTPAEKTAAAELADFLHQSTGANFPIADRANGPKIEVRYAEGLGAGVLSTDGIVIKTDGDNLLLSGGIPRGPINAVHTFLEDQVGCRWWTSSELSIPHKPVLSIDNLSITYVPKFRYRETFYFDPNSNAVFSTRLRNNGHHPQIPADWGGHYEILGFVHTSDHLIPPAKYFAAHPEWFAEVKGKRQPNSQLCLSNEAMRQELVKNALAWIKENPSAGMISISQNDTFGPCECDECKKILAEEGSQSGPWIRFVNKCAADIEKQYPDFLVETLAYQYTRKPPKVTRPAHNVIVRLCSIECDFAHPLSGETNTSFGDDLRGWAKIAPNLFIWNYTTSFADYLIPHPNLYTIGEDLKFFANNKVVSVFQEGDYHNDRAGDMLPLRVWVMAHLMWNPEQDTQTLIDEFCHGYYGPAGPEMIEYVKLVNAVAKNPKLRLTCGNHSTAFLGDADLVKADELFDSAAKAVVNDAELSRRVRRDRLALDHVHILRYDFAGKLAEIRAKSPGADVNTELLCADYQSKAKDFVASAPKLGVRNFSEGQPVASYGRALVSRCDRYLSAAKTTAGAALPAGAIDIQEDAFRLYKPGQFAMLIEDAKASNKKAARMPSTHGEWAVQAEVPDRAIGKGPWKCSFAVRVHGSSTSGNAFSFGLYDKTGNHMIAQSTGEMEIARDDEFHLYSFIVPELTSTMYFWIAPTHMDGVEWIDVDRIYLAK
jgi:hypothetical protein